MLGNYPDKNMGTSSVDEKQNTSISRSMAVSKLLDKEFRIESTRLTTVVYEHTSTPGSKTKTGSTVIQLKLPPPDFRGILQDN
jgi:hypothetical protein